VKKKIKIETQKNELKKLKKFFLKTHKIIFNIKKFLTYILKVNF
jgi:hypothetical protein